MHVLQTFSINCIVYESCLSTLCQKLNTLACYNLRYARTDFDNFGKSVNISKQLKDALFFHSPHLTVSSALPGKTWKHELLYFSLKCDVQLLLVF